MSRYREKEGENASKDWSTFNHTIWWTTDLSNIIYNNSCWHFRREKKTRRRRIERERPKLSQFESLKIRRSTFLNITKIRIDGFWCSKIVKSLVRNCCCCRLLYMYSFTSTEKRRLRTCFLLRSSSTLELYPQLLVISCWRDVYSLLVDEDISYLRTFILLYFLQALLSML